MTMEYRKLTPEVYSNSRYALIELFTLTPLTGAIGFNADNVPILGLSFDLTNRLHLHSVLVVMGFAFDANNNPCAWELPYIESIQSLLCHQPLTLKARYTQAAVDEVLTARAMANRGGLTYQRSRFRLSQEEIHRVYHRIAAACEHTIDDFVSNIPLSEERLALFSMAWFGCDFSDEHLKMAIVEGNRQEAWSRIRYRNGLAVNTKTVALNRTRYEAQLFGL